VGILDTAGVLSAGAAWRVTHAPRLGRALVKAVEHGDEDTRTIAGMLLVRGGEHGRRLVAEALRRGSESEELVTVLQSIGDVQAEEDLRTLAAQDRPVADAARRALAELQEMRRRRGNS
jgi:hypothetical protein